MIDEKVLLEWLAEREKIHQEYLLKARAKDHKYFESEILQRSLELKDIKDFVQGMAKDQENGWRPYPDTTPRNGQSCLVVVEHKGGWRTREVAIFFFGLWFRKGKARNKIVAWQPIQEYRGAENEHE